MLLTHVELRRKIEAMENKYDQQFKVIFEVIKQLIALPESKRKPQIGFRPDPKWQQS